MIESVLGPSFKAKSKCKKKQNNILWGGTLGFRKGKMEVFIYSSCGACYVFLPVLQVSGGTWTN